MTTMIAMLTLLTIRIAVPLLILFGIGESIQRVSAKSQMS